MSREVITVSYVDGAAGEQVGRAVAQHLGFRFVDEEIVRRAAEDNGVDPEAVRDVERSKGLFARVVEELGRVGPEAAGVAAPVFDTPSDDDLRRFLRDAVVKTADEGSVVIAAHAASLALADREGVLRVFVTASEPTRAARLVASGRARDQEAHKVMKQADSHRSDYVRRFYGVDRETSTLYDLVINTDRLSVEEAADLIVHCSRR